MQEYGLSKPEFIDMEIALRINLYRGQPIGQNGISGYKIATDETDSATDATNHATDATNHATDATDSTTDETNPATDETDSATDATNHATDATDLNEDELAVLTAIQKEPDLTQKQIYHETGIALGSIKRILPRLQEKGKLERVGNRRSGQWRVLN